jgi:hypothetical protein
MGNYQSDHPERLIQCHLNPLLYVTAGEAMDDLNSNPER